MLRSIRFQKTVLLLLLGILLVVFLLLLRGLIAPLLLGFIIAVWFQPVYSFLLKKLRRQGPANFLAITLVILTIIIPLILILLIAYRQMIRFASDLGTVLADEQFSIAALIQPLIDRINQIPQVELNPAQIIDYVKNDLQRFAGFLLGNIREVGSTVFNIVTGFIVFIFALAAFFPNQQKFINYLKSLSPFPQQINDLYARRVISLAIAILKGNFVVAAVIGLASGLLYGILGIKYALFWTLIAVFLNILPLGSGLITYPLGVLLLLTGQPVQGIILLVAQLLVLQNIDNVLRPRLVPKDVSLDPLLLLVSILGGLSLFGFWGFLYGPLLVILLDTTLRVYRHNYSDGVNFKP